MNYLQMVQRLFVEAGRQGSEPTTVVSQTGMNQRLVNWVLTAYEEIQAEHKTWLFRQGEFSFTTVYTPSAQQDYTYSDASLTDFAEWKFNADDDYLSGIKMYRSVSDETHLVYTPWDDFFNIYLMGSYRSQSARPTTFTVKPDFTMSIWPLPDSIYTVSGQYYKQIATLSGDTATPILPDYHMSIVWKALMYYGAFEGAPEVYAHAENEYNKMLSKLEMNYLPRIEYGPALA